MASYPSIMHSPYKKRTKVSENIYEAKMKTNMSSSSSTMVVLLLLGFSLLLIIPSSAEGECCNRCRCLDVKSYCPTTWKKCACTKSIPPQCRSFDDGPNCDPPCTVAPPLDDGDVFGRMDF
ncbi:hypothetical protein QJS10_CPB21g00120 [Acorus calamus]|uniref:Bowman-Birk serine protease inhibitors family domain-containing protein n=1 Tax=Acorus calamus TaxID=4465 RepID=A0AAV9C2X7_ACOCL|nr:hypothetical protein QJS10_CPB21g00120 [Acorus calamus]